MMIRKRNPAELEPLFKTGFECVLLLSVARCGWRLSWWPKSATGAFCSVILAASWPLLLELLLFPTVPGAALHTRLAILWLVAVSALDALAMLCAWYGWSLWVKAAPSMDDLISDCTGTEKLSQWYVKMLAITPQLVTSAAFAAFGASFLMLVAHTLRKRLEIAPISYLAVAWTCTLGANAIYWLLVNPEMTRRILRLRRLRLIWHSPASTPAIIKLSRGYGFCTCAVLVAALSTEFLALQISSYGENSLLSALTIFVPSLTGAVALFVGLAPHFWLYRAVRDARQGILGRLDLLIGDNPPSTRQAAERIYQHVELYRLVEKSPGLPFSTAAMVQYAAAVLGSLVAYFLGR
jgi:hypothetical protein